MRKKTLLWALLFVLLLSPQARAINVSADAAILMDGATGKIIFAKNIHKQRPPASITKIITAYLAISNGDLNSLVTVSKMAASEGGSSLYLREGEKLPLLDLLYGVMLCSGNDGAMAIAEHIGGSVDEFAQMMNEMARQAGALNSNFTNPHGLPDEEHYTTAYDMALITKKAMELPLFKKIVSAKDYTLTHPGLSWSRGVHNFNRLLWSFEGADGVKTGYTAKAGRCLVASATRQGRQVIAVLLNSGDRWGDAVRLLEYGLEKFRLYTVVERGEPVGKINVKGQEPVPIYAAKKLEILIPKQESIVLVRKIIVPLELKGHIPKDAPIGKMEISYDEEKFSIQLLLGEEVQKKSLLQRLARFLREKWFFRG